LEFDLCLANYPTLFIGTVPNARFMRSLVTRHSQSSIVVSNSRATYDQLKSIQAVTLVYNPDKSLVDLVNGLW
jgi:hypothetical protein